jgi:hypothetical protein
MFDNVVISIAIDRLVLWLYIAVQSARILPESGWYRRLLTWLQRTE